VSTICSAQNAKKNEHEANNQENTPDKTSHRRQQDFPREYERRSTVTPKDTPLSVLTPSKLK
jgi:hypothetical protein